MSKIEGFIKRYLLYYSDQIDREVGKIINKETVFSEQEARRLIKFINPLCVQSQLDMDAKKIVLGSPADIHMAIKAGSAIENLLEDTGYDYLIDHDKEP